MALLAANTCLLVSYVGSYKMDIQDRAMPPEVRLKRVIVPKKWRCLFRFRWSYSGDVLLCALLDEIIGIVFAVLLFIMGVGFSVFPFAYALHIMFGTILLFAFWILIHSVIGVIQYAIRKKKYYKPDPFSKKCWRLEVKAAASMKAYKTPYGKVKVLDLQATKDGQQIYAIQYGRWIVRDFYAVASKKYKPVNGTYAKAIYTSMPPHFMLLSDWCDE